MEDPTPRVRPGVFALADPTAFDLFAATQAHMVEMANTPDDIPEEIERTEAPEFAFDMSEFRRRRNYGVHEALASLPPTEILKVRSRHAILEVLKACETVLSAGVDPQGKPVMVERSNPDKLSKPDALARVESLRELGVAYIATVAEFEAAAKEDLNQAPSFIMPGDI